LLETKHISNWEKVGRVLDSIFPSLGVPIEKLSTLTEEEDDAMRKHNIEMYAKRREERPKMYEVDSYRLPVSKKFAEKLHATVVAAIDNFRGKGIPPMVVDGYSFTLRCVVEDELWTLNVHEPRGYMDDLTSLLSRIVRDAEAGNLDEQKYTALLNSKFKKLRKWKRWKK
jgi:hypothetical protein